MKPKQRKEINLRLIIIICICITIVIMALLTKEPSITYKLLQEAREEVYILHRKIDSLENERRQ